MTTAPPGVVIGATDLDATATFLSHLDLDEVARGTWSADRAEAHVGLAAETAWRRLAAPGGDTGSVLLVRTPHGGGPRPPIAAGPLAVDVYTRDLDASLARLTAAGIAVGHAGTLDLGPLVMRQCEVIAPDGWRLVLVEANHRRPSRLDDDAAALHSEVHSVLWTVPSLEEATTAFVDAGLTEAHVFPIRHPELARIIALPAEDTLLRMNLLVDVDEAPIRVELCEFPEHPDTPAPAVVLHAGIWALELDGPWATTTLLPGGVRVCPPLG